MPHLVTPADAPIFRQADRMRSSAQARIQFALSDRNRAGTSAAWQIFVLLEGSQNLAAHEVVVFVMYLAPFACSQLCSGLAFGYVINDSPAQRCVGRIDADAPFALFGAALCSGFAHLLMSASRGDTHSSITGLMPMRDYELCEDLDELRLTLETTHYRSAQRLLPMSGPDVFRSADNLNRFCVPRKICKELLDRIGIRTRTSTSSRSAICCKR